MPIEKTKNQKKVARYSDKERKFCLPERTQYDANWLPVIQNLSALGFPAADFIKNLRKNYPDVAEAIRTGVKMANSFLVAQMYKSACGYDYDEVDFKYTHNEDGSIKNKIETGGKKKRYSGSPQLAMFLAANKMPESFVNRLEISKKSNLNLFEEVPKDAIKRLAGKLLEFADKRKKVESKEV